MQHRTSARDSAQFLPTFSIFIICHRLKPSALTTRNHNRALSQWELWEIGAAWSQEKTRVTGSVGHWWVGEVTSPLPIAQGETPRMAGTKPHFSLPVVTQGVIWCAALLVLASRSQCWPILTVFNRWLHRLLLSTSFKWRHLVFFPRAGSHARCHRHGRYVTWPVLCPGRTVHVRKRLPAALFKMFAQERP